MRTKIFFSAALVALVIAAGIAWRAAIAARTAEMDQARVEALKATTESELARMIEMIATAERARADAEAALAALRTAKPVSPIKPTVAPAKSPTANQAVINPADLLSKDPRLQVMQLAAERARFETSYGPLLKRLQLSPAQIAKLRDAQVSAEEKKGDMMAIAREQKLRPDDPVLTKMSRAAEAELRAVQMEVLGAEGVDAWQRYVHTLPARGIVERFAGAMAIADKPMTAEQADRLTEIIAQASGSSSRGRLDTSTTNWTVVDERAASVLSPDQFVLFKRIEPVGGGQSRWMAQFDRAMQEARSSLAAKPADNLK